MTRLGGAAGRLLRLSTLLLALALLPRPASAEVTPRPSRHDPRVRTVAYHPMIPVRIVTSPTSSTQIILAPEEEITHVALGDPDRDAWLALPVGNLLFVKPLVIRFVTNAQIVTRRPDGRRRSYQLVLVPTPPGTDGWDAAMFAVSFTYPQDAADAAAAERARTQALNTERAVQARLAGSWAEGPRNWRYVAQGSTALEPSEVSDNGRFTVLRFPGVQPLPAVFEVGEDGAERLIPYDVRGEFVVIHGVTRGLRLRRGQSVLCLFNDAYDARGVAVGTGTASPTVDRGSLGGRS